MLSIGLRNFYNDSELLTEIAYELWIKNNYR
jgi:hypothetical protein